MAASRAIAAPVIPPPMMATSKDSVFNRSRLLSREVQSAVGHCGPANACTGFSRVRISFAGIFLERIALLAPGIAVIVVAPHLPEAAAFLRAQFDSADPFCALPTVELGHYQSQRPPVVRLKILATVTIREHHAI